MSAPRFQIRPGDVSAAAAGRRLGLSEADFIRSLPLLQARGFPKADDTTGNFDIDAIDEWRRQRHPHLFLTQTERARDARAVVKDRLGKLGHG